MSERAQEIVLIAVPVLVEAAVVVFAMCVAALWIGIGSGAI